MSNQKKISKRAMRHWPAWMPLPRQIGLTILIGLSASSAIRADNPAISLPILAATAGAAYLVVAHPGERK